MEHHDHVSSHRQRLAVAGLLIAAVPKVALMANHIQPERVCDADRGVRAGVIDEEDSVGVPLRDVAHHLDQRLGGAVRRKHDHATRPRTAPMQLAQRSHPTKFALEYYSHTVNGSVSGNSPLSQILVRSSGSTARVSSR